MAGDTTSFGVGIDHTIGALSFGIGMGTRTDEDAAMDDMGYTYSTATTFSGENEEYTQQLPIRAGVVAASSQDQKHTMISAGATYELGGGVKISAGIHHGKMTNAAAGEAKSLCVEDNTATTEILGDGMLTGDDDDGALNATGGCDDGVKATYTSLKDLDDVGVGLRIAFSF